MIDAGTLHGGEVQWCVRAVEYAVRADFTDRPFNQVGQNAVGTGRVGVDVTVTGLADRPNLMRSIVVISAADMGQNQRHLWEFVGEGNEIRRKAVRFATVRQHDCVVGRCKLKESVSMLADRIEVFLGVQFDADALWRLQHLRCLLKGGGVIRVDNHPLSQAGGLGDDLRGFAVSHSRIRLASRQQSQQRGDDRDFGVALLRPSGDGGRITRGKSIAQIAVVGAEIIPIVGMYVNRLDVTDRHSACSRSEIVLLTGDMHRYYCENQTEKTNHRSFP